MFIFSSDIKWNVFIIEAKSLSLFIWHIKPGILTFQGAHDFVKPRHTRELLPGYESTDFFWKIFYLLTNWHVSVYTMDFYKMYKLKCKRNIEIDKKVDLRQTRTHN